MNNTYLWAFGLYGLVLMAIAYQAYRRTHNTRDYLLADRSLGKWTTAISAGASDMSGWLLLGLPGYAYLAGLEAIWIALGLLIGCTVNWMYIAPRLRKVTEQVNNSITLPEFFENYFNDTTHSIKLISAVVILVFYFFYTASGLVAAGKLFATVFTVPYELAVVTGTLTILVYTVVGGFYAVCWTDLFQGLLMLIILLVTVVFGLGLLSSAAIDPLRLSTEIPHWNPFTDKHNQPLGILAVLSLLSWGLGYFGQPHILLRFMAIKQAESIGVAQGIAISWTAACLGLSIVIGMLGWLLLSVPLEESASETVYLVLLEQFFPPLLAALASAAILAAIMSTADSQLLVAATTISRDLLPLLNKNIRDQHQLWLGRIMVIVIALMAARLALQPGNSILQLVAYAWAGFGAAFGPLLLTMLYQPRLSLSAALAGMLSGGGCVVAWEFIATDSGIYSLLPAFISAWIVIKLVNRFNRQLEW